MEVPVFLPAHLSYCEKCQTDQDLIQALIKRPTDASLFFEVACQDETWARQHPKAMRGLLRWSSKAYYLGQLSLFHAQTFVQGVQQHVWLHPFLFFRSALFFTISLKIEQKEVIVNSLLFGVLSPYFYHLFRTYCFDQWRDDWTLPHVSLSIFRLVETHMMHGEIPDLWRHTEEEIKRLMLQVKAWEIASLVKECTTILTRYLNPENIVESILQAHQQLLTEWKKQCLNFFNQQGWGIHFLPGREDDLRLEILNYKEETLELFDCFASVVTHLTFSGRLSEDPLFAVLIHKTRQLKGIDLSGSLHYTRQFDDLLLELTEINLSACPWLNARMLAALHQRLPYIRELYLGNNPQLNYTSWGELKRFPYLQVLDLTRCYQMTDDDLKLIAQACSKLSEINLEECREIGDRGVGDLIHLCSHLTSLKLNRCYQLTDRSLHEIALYAYNLTDLSLVRQTEFSDKALLNLVRQRTGLRFLNLDNCEFSFQTILFIQEHYPLLHIQA